jgi:hypothetical protein
MESLTVSILHLPDEILLIIFKKLDNIDLLYSLVGVNQKLDKIACDIIFTKEVDLTTISSNDASDSKLNVMMDRFCACILLRIHNNVEALSVQASVLQNVFRTINYPNLHKLTILNLDMDMASAIFNSMLIYYYILK